MTGEASSLSVQPEDVKALGRLAYDVATQCRDGYSSLNTDIQTMLDSWSGNNADAFGVGWEEFHQGAVDVWDALFELAASLGVTAEAISHADQSFAAGVGSLDLP
jgi:WXG100 family type VII secretion target